MSFIKYLYTPKLYKDYTAEGGLAALYTLEGLEKFGSSLVGFWSLMYSLAKYGSPLITLYLYKRGYFASDSIGQLVKIGTGIGILVMLSYCLRGYGRSQNARYRKFIEDLERAKSQNDSVARRKIRLYDFEFEYWPVDWSIKSSDTKENKTRKQVAITARGKVNWLSPCSIAAYVAIHTFGLKMIYPGSIRLLQKYLHPMLVQGRAKLIAEHGADRNKIETADGNHIDTIFVDNRQSGGENGKTLVITAEGNAGFYEIGIMVTPVDLKYSVLGFNHPGFGGSNGEPYTDQDQNAADAVIQFAIQKLRFLPENILLFGWSIGGYTSYWLASQYPGIRGIVLDATFDDLLPLAIPRMPESIENIVKIAIREHCNLNNTDLIPKYNGPLLFIRRTDDEVICTEEMNIGTNRVNYLIANLMKYRFPNIFQTEQLKLTQRLLNKMFDPMPSEEEDQVTMSLILSYASEHGASYPFRIGEDYSKEQKDQMAFYLLKTHLLDYKSTHCTPLPGDFFRKPWDIPNEDFVFT